MADLATAAGMMRLAMRVGLIAPTDVTRWAEAGVAASAAPSIEVIELALVPEARWIEIDLALAAITNDKTEVMGRLVMSLAASRVEGGSMGCRAAARIAYDLAWEIFDLDDGVRWKTWYWRFDDLEYDYDDPAIVEAKFRRFLGEFLGDLPEARLAMQGDFNGSLTAGDPTSTCPEDGPPA